MHRFTSRRIERKIVKRRELAAAIRRDEFVVVDTILVPRSDLDAFSLAVLDARRERPPRRPPEPHF